jgi:regulator of RNase E activity RraA
VGEVHAYIQKALGCIGAVTNGAVRDLEALEAAGYQVFAGNVSVSHAFVHMVDFGGRVEVGGLRVDPGDLILGDRHGVLTVPKQVAPEIPTRAESIARRERRVIEYCKSEGFSLEALRKVIRETELVR